MQTDVDKLLSRYLERVIEAGGGFNLFSRRVGREGLERLMNESLFPLNWSPCRLQSPLLDIGSGAGFPGIPLKIVRPELTLTLLDADRKKTSFLRMVTAELGLMDVEVIQSRAEQFALDPARSGYYSTIVSRGIGGNEVLKWAQSLLCAGGEIILWKGSKSSKEMVINERIWSTPDILVRPNGLTIIRAEKFVGC